MRSRLFPLIVVLLVCLLTGHAQTVNETGSSMILKDTSAEISLAVDSARKVPSIPVTLELLDEKNTVRASTAQNFPLKKGRNLSKITLPLGDLMKTAEEEIYWFRLQYRVGETTGVISLSELLREIFELRASVPRNYFTGRTYRVRVRALNPFSLKPVKDVQIDGEFSADIETDSDEDELKLKASGRTDGKGFVVLDFKIPEGLMLDDESDLDITGKKNGIIREIDGSPEIPEDRAGVFLTADKPLYQPGQSFNARGIFLDANYHVVPGRETGFQIEDEDETVLYRSKAKTSEYGIASVAWKIPDNAKLGAYVLKVLDDDGDEMESSSLYFKVTRYDLPNFAVTAKTDRTYYLPSDRSAAFTIAADYLFGKPVTRGKVRIVEESERRWNWREQKYDSKEGRVFEGETGPDGKYIADVDLGPEIDAMNGRQWERFKDLSYAAYFTDLDTNRTEQKRFDVRITKEPIHIYFVRYSNNNPKLPARAYFSTFYADGSPAICDVTVTGGFRQIIKTKTNDLGAAKLVFDFPEDFLDKQYYGLKIAATDKKGLTGTFSDDIYLDKKEAIQVVTDKTIYSPGDAIDMSLVSTLKDSLIYIDVVKDGTVIGSYFVKLRNGKADLRLPYDEAFKGDLTIAAYTDEIEDYHSPKALFTRGIIFPEQQNLRVDAKFSGDTYRPGEEARVKFSVFEGNGRAAQSALGVVVFDKAVEERAKTDAAFGSYFSRFYGMMGYDQGFGAITLKDLNDLDLSRPVPDEMQLAAEVMLAINYYYPDISHSSNDLLEARSVYAEYFTKQFTAVETALKDEFGKTFRFPTEEMILRKMLLEKGIDIDKLKDPWGLNYTPVFSTDRSRAVLTFKTAGADKTHGTEDDFEVSSVGVPYFEPVGRKIDEAITQFHKETGLFIQDQPALLAALKKNGIGAELLKDRWNRDYRFVFEIEKRNLVIKFRSAGENGQFEDTRWRSDDFDVWTNYTDYFTDTEISLSNTIAAAMRDNKSHAPKDEDEFKRMLKNNGLDLAAVRDVFGESVVLTSERQTRYVDKVVIENGEQKITPVSQQMLIFKLRSKGPDRVISADDFDLATFSTETLLALKGPYTSTGTAKEVVFAGAKGAVRGVVTDSTGASVPGATATATSETDTTISFTTETNDDGVFLLQNLPSGRYSVTVTMPGFQPYKYSNINVRSMVLMEIKVSLEVGTVTASVEITAAPSEINQSSASMSSVKSAAVKGRMAVPPEQNSTPRLREYFPETLLWNPELITDKKGKAELKFNLADNITTWKLYTIASTKKGKIGVAEKEITAFQPFFVDLEPPKFLTNGDEISLPVQVRNYTEKKQDVGVTMTKANWFSFLGQEKQQIDVGSGDSKNAVFGFKAIDVVKDGKQRVTALAQGESDVIEKPVTVRPDGEEIVKTETNVFNGMTAFDVNFPANALPKTQKAEIKIYPNLFSHVTESVEGLLQRPYGCGEQTISSTYPNLMILKFIKNDGKLVQKAQKYLQKGYERLIGYQVEGGGFTYWGGKDTPDVALTAYALRFLNDAKEFIEVDESVVANARDWLIKQQHTDGSWTKKYYYETFEDPGRTKLFTSYVARTLAKMKEKDAAPLQKALLYLKARNAEIAEPYALALYGLAQLESGNTEAAEEVAGKLEKMPIAEGNFVYWKLETNTPFYGWGMAGRLETTALVLQLLTKLEQTANKPSAERAALISKGMGFLLRSKDRYGVWYSTQTTINVLDTFLAAMSAEKAGDGAAETLQVIVNGVVVQNYTVTPDRIEPFTIELPFDTASNKVEIRGSSDTTTLMAQVVASHYIDWKDSESTGKTVNASRALRLDYKCDRQSAPIMQEITCSVETERVGFRGYGMLLAEIGTPPGADVSRESLQAAMEADWTISRYDILPDRIVFYMWAKAGGTKFNFKFKPRYGINAQTPASIVYDYYNPDAKAVAAPLRFAVGN